MQSLNLPFSCIYIKVNNNLPHAIHVPLPLPLPSESFTKVRFSKRIYQNDNQLFKAPRYCSWRQWLIFVHRCSPRMWRERLTFLQQMLQYFQFVPTQRVHQRAKCQYSENDHTVNNFRMSYSHVQIKIIAQ